MGSESDNGKVYFIFLGNVYSNNILNLNKSFRLGEGTILIIKGSKFTVKSRKRNLNEVRKGKILCLFTSRPNICFKKLINKDFFIRGFRMLTYFKKC